mgnify:CR=1 FL=1
MCEMSFVPIVSSQNTAITFETACRYLSEGNYLRAIPVLQELSLLEEAGAEVFSKLGVAYIQSGRREEALVCFKKAIQKNPNYPEAYNNLMLSLYESGQAENAEQVCSEASEKFPSRPEFLSFLSYLYKQRGELQKASEALTRLIDISPLDSISRCNLGILYYDMGQEKEAAERFEQATKLDPLNTEAVRMLSLTTTHTTVPGEVKKYKDMLKSLPVNDKRSSDLHFTLGKYFEDIGDYRQSFSHYKSANDIVARQRHFLIDKEAHHFEKIKRIFTDGFMKSRRQWGIIDKTPIFIVGMPRSGTSLVEQILASHSMVFGGGELTYLDSIIHNKFVSSREGFAGQIHALSDADFKNMAQSYITGIRSRDSQHVHITDKMPHNFRFIGLIKIMFPNARVIHCVRDPMDVCMSMYKRYFPAANMDFSYTLQGLGRYYCLYRDLMQHWHNVLPGSIYDVRYEDLVHDQKSVTEHLLSYCKLPWEDTCLHYHQTDRVVSTASALQVKRPIYKTSIKAWERFAPYVEELIAIVS